MRAAVYPGGTDMDHVTAFRELTAAGYVLKELSEGEARDFEAHLRECAACADDVLWARAFLRAAASAR